jgi:hypothetical protein
MFGVFFFLDSIPEKIDNPPIGSNKQTMKTDTTAAIAKVDAQLTEARAQLDKAKEQTKVAKERVAKLEDLMVKLGSPEELLAYAIDALMSEGKLSSTQDAAPVIGQPQIDKIVGWLKANPGKFNSAKICGGATISKEDWKASKALVDGHPNIKADKGKGQAKAYQFKA